MNISKSIFVKACELYNYANRGEIYRGGSRKAIIFACGYYAYELEGKYQNPESFKKDLGINNKTALKGLEMLMMKLPKDILVKSEITEMPYLKNMIEKVPSRTQKWRALFIYTRKLRINLPS